MQLRRRLGWRDVIVGISITLAVILLMIGIIAVGGESGGFWQPKVSYYVVLPTASGLYVGSLVMIDGIEVGSVRAIEFNPDGPGVRIHLRLNAQFQHRIRADSVAAVKSLGLLGDRYIDIRAGSPQKASLPPGSVIPATEVFDYEALVPRFAALVDELQETLERARGVVEQITRGEGLVGALVNDPELRDQVKTTVAAIAHGQGTLGRLIHDATLYRDLEQTVQRLRDRSTVVGMLLYDPDRARQLGETLDRLHRIATRLESGEGTAGRLLQDERLYEELTATLQQIRLLLDPDQNPNGTLYQLLRDPTLYRDVREAVTDVRRLIADIRKNPKKYLAVKIALIAF